jgi:hypothetical protein
LSIGRPTLYDDKFCVELIEHMKAGYSFESFAGSIGVNRDTLYEWAKVNPEFSDAKKIGTEAGRLFWETKGIEGLFSTTERCGDQGSSKSINATIWIFNMKNRFGWRDKQPDEEEESSSPKGPLVLSYSLSDEETKRR